jgi:hypothetical protein
MPDNGSIGKLIADLCQTNTDLWHQEDDARCNDIQKVAAAKKNVDKLNQKRNDLIEKIDDYVIEHVQKKAGSAQHG